MKYSIVIPAYNEEQVLPVFYEKAIPVFEKIDGEFEVIIVSDGSKDKTNAIIEELCQKDKRIKGVTFSRNFGQQAAFLCGMTYATGDYIQFMDADLQDPPEVALMLMEKAKEGYDIVHARHKRRKGETIFKKLTAFAYYRTLKNATGLDLPLDCGDFMLLSRKAANAILSLGEHTRLLRVQSVWVGFKQTVVEFDRPERAAGESKYTLAKMIRLAMDGIIPNAKKPMGLTLKIGLCFSVLSVLGFIALIVLSILGVDYGGVPTWILPTLLLAVGVLSLENAMQGQYVASIYEEVKERPKFIVDKTFNVEE